MRMASGPPFSLVRAFMEQLSEHIAQEEAELARGYEPPAEPAAPAPVADAVADVAPAEAEADSDKPDDELSEAGRSLRKGRADKRAAKIEEDNDRLSRALQRRRELRDEEARYQDAPPPRREREPVAQARSTDEDPAPNENDFA